MVIELFIIFISEAPERDPKEFLKAALQKHKTMQLFEDDDDADTVTASQDTGKYKHFSSSHYVLYVL